MIDHRRILGIGQWFGFGLTGLGVSKLEPKWILNQLSLNWFRSQFGPKSVRLDPSQTQLKPVKVSALFHKKELALIEHWHSLT